MRAPTAILTPWYRRGGAAAVADESGGSLAATRILDHGSPAVTALVARARIAAEGTEPLAVLAAAHAIVAAEVRAVYALDELTPASRVLRRGRGSCSQRLAVLESVARAIGVPTRVRALLVDRSFWYPRFPRTRFALPDRMMLAWPSFRIDGGWRAASELFGPIGCRGGGGFANRGAETLFEAVGRCAVDWDGVADGEYDLSRFVRADYGVFADRDELFARRGQTLCAPVRALGDPVLRRVAA
jgi:transglutaminase-like putative cysteine protease